MRMAGIICIVLLVSSSSAVAQLPDLCPGQSKIPNAYGYQCVPQSDVPRYFGPQPDLTAPQYNPVTPPDARQNFILRGFERLEETLGLLESNRAKSLYGSGPLSNAVQSQPNLPKPPPGFRRS